MVNKLLLLAHLTKREETTPMQAHKVPTHIGMPDRMIFGLTPRQLLITLIGCSIGYDIWLHLSVLLAYGVVGLIARLICSLVPAGLALSIALITVAGRSLEVWALVVLRYQLQPKVYVWRSLRTVVPTGASQQQQSGKTAWKTRILQPWERE
jgi:hypothetical protein